MYVVAFGNPADGIHLVGPFAEHDDAVNHADGAEGDWWVMNLNSADDNGADSREIRHTITDASDHSQQQEVLIQTDEHGLTIELPDGQVITIDLSGGKYGVGLSL